MKKLLSFLLVFCMLLPVLAHAEEPATPTDLECAHANVTTEEEVTGDPEYESVDETQHKAITRVWVYDLCEDCGEQLNGHEEERSEVGSHNYDVNGICSDCGYQKPCAHENISSAWRWLDSESGKYEVLSNREHRETGRIWVFDWCENCGEELNGHEEERSEVYSHNYDENGVCEICGYKNTCTHENTWPSWYWLDDDNVKYESVSNKEHRETGRVWAYDWCPDCYTELNGHEEDRSELSNHDYNEDGVCSRCGHKNTCTHENTSPSWWWKDYDSVKIESIDNKEHRESGRAMVCDRCEDCEAELNIREEDRSEVFSHDYNGEGICSRCGHKNTCTHERISANWWWTNPEKVEYTSIDNRTHKATGEVTTYDWCPDCYTTFNSKNTHETRTEYWNHDYNNNGVCVNCGHKNTCNHAKTQEDWWWKDYNAVTYTSIDDLHHKAVGEARIVTRCSECDIEIKGSVRIEKKTATFSHDYGANGICTECGHKSACLHDGGTYYSEYYDSSNVKDNGDGKTHTVTILKGTLRECCSICNAPLKITPIANVTRISAHWYNNGSVCMECGYLAEEPCKHEHTTTSQWAQYGEVLDYEPVDAYSHKTSGLMTTSVYCQDCGTTLESTNQYGTKIDQHNFVNGICSNCGYRNTCAHEHTKTEKYCAYRESVSAITDTKHTIHGIIRTSVWCEDCYETISYSDEKNADLTEKHNFYQGVCTDCGYVNTCKHEHIKEVISPDTRQSTYKPVDGTNHRVTGPGWITETCQDCGENFSTRTEDKVSKLEEHTMKDGVCTKCGYISGQQAGGEGDESAVSPEEQAIAENVESMFSEETLDNITVTVTTDETTGDKTVTVTTNEGTDGVFMLNTTAETIKTLADQNVSEITMTSSDGTTGLIMDVDSIVTKLEANPTAELIVEFDSQPEIDEAISEKLEEDYDILEDAVIAVVRIILKQEDGTEIALDQASINLKVEMEKIEGLKFIYVDEEGNIFDVAAVYVEATETVPGYWKIPFMGNGNYLPVVPKTK